MAGRMNMKVFYAGLVAIAVVGGGAIWMANSRGGATARILEAPIPVAAAAFDGYVLGSSSAPVKVIEYSDFMCPWCARFAVVTMPDVRQRLISTGQVEWRFRDFVIHQEGLVAHHAAACAGEQEKFWEMHDQLYFNQRDWAESSRMEGKFRDYARMVGADMDQYDTCMNEARYVARLQATRNEAQSYGVSSTPTFIIGNTIMAGALPYDSIAKYVQQIIDQSQ